MLRPDVVILDAPASGHGIAWMAAPQLVSEVINSGPIGNMAAGIAAFLEDRERFGTVVVTTAEEMPVQEALELLEAMRNRLDRAPELVIANAVYPPVNVEDPGADAVTRLWAQRRKVNDEELKRLTESWQGPIVEIPLVPVDAGPTLVGLVGEHIAGELRKT